MHLKTIKPSKWLKYLDILTPSIVLLLLRIHIIISPLFVGAKCHIPSVANEIFVQKRYDRIGAERLGTKYVG